MKHNPKITPWCCAASALALALVIRPLPAVAADKNPPAYMTYQSYLVDANGVALGNAAPKNYDVIFRIYNDQIAGTKLWAEQQTLTVDKGYFSVLLGEGSAVGAEAHPIISTLFTGTDISDRYIEMTVKGIGSGSSDVVIKPRLRLMTSPYAFVAQNALSAASLVNSSNSAVVNVSGGYVGINRVLPGAALDVNGNALVSGTVTASGALSGASLTVSGAVAASGALSGGTLAVAGAATVNSLTVVTAATANSLIANSLIVANATVSGTINASTFAGNGTVPLGGIIMWSGATVPTGWTLCNGVTAFGQPVPDLRGRFILGGNVGSGATYTDATTGLVSTNGTTGGEAKHTLSFAEMPVHQHGYGDWRDSDNFGDSGGDTEAEGDGVGRLDSFRNTAFAGGGLPHNTLPPFYVLAYIMRVQ
jgi:hypothetical protein